MLRGHDNERTHELLTVDEAARLLGLSAYFVYTHPEELGRRKVPGGGNRYPAQTVQAYAAKRARALCVTDAAKACHIAPYLLSQAWSDGRISETLVRGRRPYFDPEDLRAQLANYPCAASGCTEVGAISEHGFCRLHAGTRAAHAKPMPRTQRTKIADALRGKPHPDDRRDNQREGATRRWKRIYAELESLDSLTVRAVAAEVLLTPPAITQAIRDGRLRATRHTIEGRSFIVVRSTAFKRFRRRLAQRDGVDPRPDLIAGLRGRGVFADRARRSGKSEREEELLEQEHMRERRALLARHRRGPQGVEGIEERWLSLAPTEIAASETELKRYALCRWIARDDFLAHPEDWPRVNAVESILGLEMDPASEHKAAMRVQEAIGPELDDLLLAAYPKAPANRD